MSMNIQVQSAVLYDNEVHQHNAQPSLCVLASTDCANTTIFLYFILYSALALDCNLTIILFRAFDDLQAEFLDIEYTEQR